ncbi:unnamed protein product, partial [Medioppia subpectinata]
MAVEIRYETAGVSSDLNCLIIHSMKSTTVTTDRVSAVAIRALLYAFHAMAGRRVRNMSAITTGLILKGWKNPLTSADLWAVRREDRCRKVYGEFSSIWKGTKLVEELTAEDDERVVSELSGKSGDIKLLIAFTTDPLEPDWHGYMYACLLIFTNIFQSLINGYQSQRMAVLGMRIRTCLISAVYRKSLVLSNHSKTATTSGEIVNLMAVDAQRFVDMLPYLSFLWTAPVQVGISLYLLYNEMGYATFGGLVVMLMLIPINGYVSAKIQKIQTKQMKLKDERVRGLNEILGGIKVLKLYGWEEAFVDNILAIRRRELNLIRKSGLISGVTVVLAGITPFLVALVTFGIYIAMGNTLDAQKAFVSIALFNLLRIPLTIVPNMVTSLILTLVSVKRLDKFLNFSELMGYVNRNKDQKEVIKVENASFTWERVEDVVDGGLKPTLDKINLKVMKGKFVAVVGNVGSGKSSLLSALLGDMEICSGSVNINGNSELAYVPQQAWIQNATLKDNILFGKEFDSKKYRKIIKACALKSDLLTLAGGDETEIGEKGINLSGGQKQR